MNGRARALVEALEEDYDVTVVSERLQRMDGCGAFRRADLREHKLAFGARSLLHVGGAIRVLQLNWIGLREARRRRSDVVICADVPYCIAGVLAKKLFGARFIFDAYEIFWGLGDGPLLSAVFKIAEKFILKRADLWLVPSAERGEIVRREQRLPLPYTVVPNLPTIGEIRGAEMRGRLLCAGVPADRPTLLFQGTLVPRRGLTELLQAAELGGFHLIVQGEGPLRGFVEENRGANVTLLPPCPNDEAVSWLAAVTASFVYYENDCINSAYACSSKFTASLIAGTPVVCNDLPVFRSFAAKHGACVIIPELEAREIAAAVEKLIAPPAREERRQEAAAAGAMLRAFPRREILRKAVAHLCASARRESHRMAVQE